MSKLNTLIYNIITKLNTIPTSLNQLKDDSTHRLVTDTEKNNWNSKNSFSGSYKDLKNKPTISKQGYTSGATWYFPLGKMVIDNSGNYGNFTFTGRLGGWTNDNSATFSIMLMNRANYSGDVITSTVSASGKVEQALNLCDIVVAKNSDNSHTVYLQCVNYFLFDFAYTEFQHSVIYDSSYQTTAPSDIIWKLSTAPKTILYADGSFQATGGIVGMPTKVSQLTNDSGYLTSIPSEYVTESELNAKNYATKSQIPTIPSTYPASSITGLAKVATSGSYNDLSNKPTILAQANKGYNGAITTGSDGVAEMGKYIDFHENKDSTKDYDTRFVCTGQYGNTVNLPSVAGTLVVGDKGYKIVVSSTAPTVDDKNVITLVV